MEGQDSDGDVAGLYDWWTGKKHSAILACVFRVELRKDGDSVLLFPM